MEFQSENLPAEQVSRYLDSGAFAANPIGVEFDPDYLLERLHNGDDPTELRRQGAGTRPGSKTRANKHAITWKTL